MSRTVLLSDPRFLAHDPGQGHPESPARLRSIVAGLENRPVAGTTWLPPRLVTEAEMTAVHSAEHVALMAAQDRQLNGLPDGSTEGPIGRPLVAHGVAQMDPDTAMSAGTWQAARLAAGASIQAVEEVLAARADNAFVLCRPPGHHAESTRAMGFCFLNNAAVAAAAARRLGASRVAIVDWDVHHGNGTQHLFEDRADILFLSAHQFPFYPGTGDADEIGHGAGAGFTVNCPLPPGQTDADYGAVFDELFLPALQRFAPDMVIVSAGFDAHARDPLGEMRVTERGFAAMCSGITSITSKLVLLLEGGYDLEALTGSVRACVEVMRGARESFPSGVAAPAPRVIASVRAAHARAPRPLLR